MGNYYLQKRNYNKYNPTGSISDLDCYGKNYYENDITITKDEIKLLDNEKKFNEKKFNTVYKTKVSSNLKKKEPSLFFVIFLIFTFLFSICVCFYHSVKENTVVSIPVGLTFLTLIISFIESLAIIFISYFLMKIIIPNKVDFDNEIEKYFYFLEAMFFSFILIQTFNCGLIYLTNQRLDKSKPIKRYLQVTNKTFQKSYSSKSKNERTTYYLRITSWLNKGTYLESVSKSLYDYHTKGDILVAVTRSGYYNMPYYVSFSLGTKFDSNYFPPDTEFPLTEEEANKIIEERKK